MQFCTTLSNREQMFSHYVRAGRNHKITICLQNVIRMRLYEYTLNVYKHYRLMWLYHACVILFALSPFTALARYRSGCYSTSTLDLYVCKYAQTIETEPTVINDSILLADLVKLESLGSRSVHSLPEMTCRLVMCTCYIQLGTRHDFLPTGTHFTLVHAFIAIRTHADDKWVPFTTSPKWVLWALH